MQDPLAACRQAEAEFAAHAEAVDDTPTPAPPAGIVRLAAAYVAATRLADVPLVGGHARDLTASVARGRGRPRAVAPREMTNRALHGTLLTLVRRSVAAASYVNHLTVAFARGSAGVDPLREGPAAQWDQQSRDGSAGALVSAYGFQLGGEGGAVAFAWPPRLVVGRQAVEEVRSVAARGFLWSRPVAAEQI